MGKKKTKQEFDTLLELNETEFQERDRSLPTFIASLKKFAKKFLKDEYNMTLDIPIKVISNKSSRHGYYKWNSVEGPICITLNRNMVQISSLLNIDIAEKVLKHELVHYALNVQGRKSSDGDEDFENELIRVGAPSSKAKGGNSSNMVDYPTLFAADVIYYVDVKTDEVIYIGQEIHKPTYPSKKVDIIYNGKEYRVNKFRAGYKILQLRKEN